MQVNGQINQVGKSSSNIKLECLSTDPVAKLGRIYFNTTTNSFQVYNGIGWQKINPVVGLGTAGYVFGGYPSYATIDRLVFSNENTNALTSTLSAGRRSPSGFSSTVYGYSFGGDGVANIIELLTFFNNSCSSISTSLPIASYYGAEADACQSPLAGYVMGGATATAVQKMLFSNNNIVILSATLSTGRSAPSCYNSAINGYVCDGGSTVIEKISFSTDVRSSVTGSLTQAGYGQGQAGYNSLVAGYDAGGYLPGLTAKIEKLNFSTEANALIASTLSYPNAAMAGFNSGLAGYVGGSWNSYTTIEKLLFSNDTSSTLASGISAGRYYVGAYENLG